MNKIHPKTKNPQSIIKLTLAILSPSVCNSARHRSKSDPKKLAILSHVERLFFAATSFAIALFLVEISVRVLHKVNHPGSSATLIRQHSLYGWEKIPGARGLRIGNEFKVHEEINAKGLRGPEFQYEKAKGRERILILGDSFAEGYTVSYDQLFSTLLHDRLNRNSHKTVEVINAGTTGYSTDQEYLFLTKEGFRYQPDVVVLMFYQNDVLFNGRPNYYHDPKPSFVSENGKLTLKHPKASLPKSSPPTTHQWFRSHSRLYEWLVVKIHGTGLITGPDHVPEEYRVWKKTARKEEASAWKITELLLGKMAQESKQRGAKFFVFYIPHRSTIHEKEWERFKSLYRLDSTEWTPHRVAIRLKGITKRLGISLIEPTTELRQRARQWQDKDQRLYFERDDHWTAHGHLEVAEILYHALAGAPGLTQYVN